MFVPAEAARKPPKQQKRGNEAETALIVLLREIMEGQARDERRMTRFEDSSASRDETKTIVKKAQGGLKNRTSRARSLFTNQAIS